eukprot:TRINITY_DN748_c0_g1_i4.p1 TRINITY_DN748_c0_g1~~TRINITY_DN748_c0_g1_i4.p1  ORF type:complete len:290 (-),score=47.63 TRINITY_DN748_c0_g1_i4:513-1382(-)
MYIAIFSIVQWTFVGGICSLAWCDLKTNMLVNSGSISQERPWHMMRPRSDSEYSETPLRVFGTEEAEEAEAEADSHKGLRRCNNGRLIVIISAVFLGLIIVVGSIIGFLQFTDIFEVKTEQKETHPDSHGIVYNCTAVPLKIYFPSGDQVHCGNELSKANASTAPNVTFPAAEPSTGYLLVMLDPDAPSRQEPTRAPVRHWLVGNIIGSEFHVGSFGNASVTISPYRGPGPPNGTGLHRYGFFAFAQPTPTLAFDPLNISLITNFDVVGFLEHYGIGSVASSNYFTSQF